MHKCRECRYFSFDPGVPVGGSIELGRCLLGDFIVAQEERACESRTPRRGEIVRRRSGGFALVAEDQPRWAGCVIVRGLHTTRNVPRREVEAIDDMPDYE